MATNSTPSACGGDCAADEDADGICDDEDDCVGALDACGVCTVLARSTSADAPTSLRAIATAAATNSTPSALAVVIVLRTKMPMAFVTTKMTALEPSMLAAWSTLALARSTSADVRDSRCWRSVTRGQPTRRPRRGGEAIASGRRCRWHLR